MSTQIFKGFIGGAVVNVPLSDKLGFGKVVAYTLMAPALPFPALVVAYAINGVGIALQANILRQQDAQANGFVASLESHAETKMGVLHAVYGLSLANTVLLIVVFRFKRQDDATADQQCVYTECLREIGQVIPENVSDDNNRFRQILGQKTVHLLAFYILVYVGVEVTIGGWIVTFIIEERNGGPSSGYISAGFFGGLMFGRVALLWVNEKIGERLAIFVYAILAIGLELVVWLVPSLIGNAVAVSIVGVLLGPMYPIAMNHAGRVLPRWILTGSIGWIAGFGQAGSAVLPFMTGAISSKFGIKSLQPLLVSMMGLLIVMWALVPRGPRRAD
ncbi:hypothetical protein D9615_008381 [Tricholomella constricta]|uniref:Major facilitator superfamily (MFS) profile domain-containing protein n=1 Tax=Tricholomella constricta TaxID=117010 RepID=A0A8H5HE35_9AGAR|nr:hypothetical protein D9615_008381 [Tricholomella constricta]